MFSRNPWCGLALICWIVVAATPVQAYILVPLPTLGYTTAESNHVMLVQVEKVSREKGVIIYRKVRDLRGNYPKDTVKHVFNLKEAPSVASGMFRPEVAEWSYILQWAEPGQQAVIFIRKQNNSGDSSLTYIDQCWYASSSAADDWVWFHTLYSSSELLRSYFCGSPARLATAVDQMVAQGANLENNPVVPILHEGSIAELRAGRAKVRGRRAGGGRLDVNLARDTAPWEDPKGVEALIKTLKEGDGTARLQAAKELAHWFGPEIKSAQPALTAALKHDDPATRRAAAVALANAFLDAAGACPALCEALEDADAEVAVHAAGALGALRSKDKAASAALQAALAKKGALAEAAASALILGNPDIETQTPAVTALLEQRASVDGKYQKLSQRIKAPQDLLAQQFFQDRAAIVGINAAVPDYQGHKDVPKGYWVYVFPYWYIWSEQAKAK